MIQTTSSNLLAPALRPLGITLGDPSGIGPEIVLKLHMQALPRSCVVYGDVGVLTRTAKQLGLAVQVNPIKQLSELATQPAAPGQLFVLQSGPILDVNLPVGLVNVQSGQAAYDALNRAIDDTLAGHVAGLVTAPLSKEAMHLAGVPFPGHTEILAHRCGDLPVAMVLVNPQLRVILVTIHLPLAKVPAAITTEHRLILITFLLNRTKDFADLNTAFGTLILSIMNHVLRVRAGAHSQKQRGKTEHFHEIPVE